MSDSVILLSACVRCGIGPTEPCFVAGCTGPSVMWGGGASLVMESASLREPIAVLITWLERVRRHVERGDCTGASLERKSEVAVPGEDRVVMFELSPGAEDHDSAWKAGLTEWIDGMLSLATKSDRGILEYVLTHDTPDDSTPRVVRLHARIRCADYPRLVLS